MFTELFFFSLLVDNGNILQENLLGAFTQLFSNLWGSDDGWGGRDRNKNGIRCSTNNNL